MYQLIVNRNPTHIRRNINSNETHHINDPLTKEAEEALLQEKKEEERKKRFPTAEEKEKAQRPNLFWRMVYGKEYRG